MKKLTIALVIALVASGCATNYRAEKTNVNVWKNFGSINIRSQKISEKEFLVVARGAGNNNEAEVLAAWNEFAEKIAAGQPYTKETNTEGYSYSAYGSPGRHQAKQVIGKVILK